MTEPLPIPKHIAVAAHPKMPKAVSESEQVAAFLADLGALSTHGLLSDRAIIRKIKTGELDLLVALGGDGTMLRAGHLCGPSGVPVLGINQGRFGFLMEIRRDQWRNILPRLFTGDFWLENRMMLSATLWRAAQIVGEWEILNEVLIGRGNIARPVHLETEVDGRFLTTYVADGLIAATPTGSTAYALAAGGPILPPDLRNILLVPVAPHLSVDRAIVLSEGSSVSITVHTTHQAVLSIDGQDPVWLDDGDKITVNASKYSVKFLRFQDPGYFYRNLTPHMNQNPATGNMR